MYVYKISKNRNIIKIETDSNIIEFPLLENDLVENILKEINEENFIFQNIIFVEYCLKNLLKILVFYLFKI